MLMRFLLCTAAAVVFGTSLFSQTGQPLRFDAAEIQRSPRSAADSIESGSYQNGRVIVHNATLHMLMQTAYGVRMDLIQGGPKWFDEDRFDVAAKADPTTTEADSRLMLRALLEERLQLAVHHEENVTPAFALIVSKDGPKLQPAEQGSQARMGCRGTPLRCHRLSMDALAPMLQWVAGGDIDRPVVNLTGLKGEYDFDLPLAPGPGSIFAALEKLGLRAEARKLPVDYLVIDRVQRLEE